MGRFEDWLHKIWHQAKDSIENEKERFDGYAAATLTRGLCPRVQIELGSCPGSSDDELPHLIDLMADLTRAAVEDTHAHRRASDEQAQRCSGEKRSLSQMLQAMVKERSRRLRGRGRRGGARPAVVMATQTTA